MVERALHWTEELLARVAVRQVVLLGRVFAVNGLACPTCGKVMVLRAEVRRPGPEGRRR